MHILYLYIYTHTHAHTSIYIYIYIHVHTRIAMYVYITFRLLMEGGMVRVYRTTNFSPLMENLKSAVLFLQVTEMGYYIHSELKIVMKN